MLEQRLHVYSRAVLWDLANESVDVPSETFQIGKRGPFKVRLDQIS